MNTQNNTTLFRRVRTSKFDIWCNACRSKFKSAVVIDPNRDLLCFVEVCDLPEAMRQCMCHCKQEEKAIERILGRYTEGKTGANRAHILANTLAWMANNAERFAKYQHPAYRIANALFCQAGWSEFRFRNTSHIIIAIELWQNTIPKLIQQYETNHLEQYQNSAVRRTIELTIGYTIIVSEPIGEAAFFARQPKPISNETWRNIVRSACDIVDAKLINPNFMASKYNSKTAIREIGEVERRCNRWHETLIPR